LYLHAGMPLDYSQQAAHSQLSILTIPIGIPLGNPDYIWLRKDDIEQLLLIEGQAKNGELTIRKMRRDEGLTYY